MSDTDERRRHWNDVYTGRPDTEVSWFQPRPEVSLEIIGGLDLPPAARIIDVGGGASRLVDHLVDLGHDVTVLDVSPNALETSRARLGDRAARVHWIEADVTSFEPASRFDVWHDRAVFHFLTDANDRARYVARMTAALEPAGFAILATFALDGPTRCSGLPVVRYDEAALSHELGPEYRLVTARRELHRTPADREQAFVYCLFARSRVPPR